MTSELKPCPFCWPEPHMTECHQDDYGYWKVSCGRCGCHSGIRPKSDPDARSKVITHWNTRAVPDVPELVRYEYDILLGKMDKYNEGEYVRYDQAAVIISAKDASYNKLEAAWLNAEGKITELEAKLAQIKAQEPVAWMHPTAGWTDVSKSKIAAHCKHGTDPKPLYAAPVAREDKCFECEGELTVTCLRCNAPVDQTAEIERLRGYVAGLVTWIEDEVGAELPFAIDRTALSGKEPS